MSGVILALVVGIGVILSHLGLRRAGWRGWHLMWLSAGFGPGVGFGLASLQLFFWRSAGFAPPGPLSFVSVAAAIGLAIWRLSPAHGPLYPVRSRFSTLPRLVGYLALAVSAASMLTAYGAIKRAWPDGLWDAVAIYNVRARLYHERYADFPLVLREISAASHPNYPLLLPGAIAAQQSLIGRRHAGVPIVTGLTFVIAVGVLVYGILRTYLPGGIAAGTAAVVWATPQLWLTGFGQLADGPTAYYFLGAVAVVASQTSQANGPRIPAWLGGFFMGCLAFTKNEGVVMVAWLIVLFVLSHFRRWSPLLTRWREVGGGFFLGLLPGAAALWTLKRSWAPDSGLDVFFPPGWVDRIGDFERWWIPVRQIALRVTAQDSNFEWSYAWPVVMTGVAVAGLVRRWGGSADVRLWTFAALGIMCSWIPIYAVSPYGQVWHISTSIDRLLLQVYPVALAGVTLALGTPSRRSASPPA
jgi:hypothetical protein